MRDTTDLPNLTQRIRQYVQWQADYDVAAVLLLEAADALDALARPRAEPHGWQPIETAPHHTEILAFVPGDGIGVATFYEYADRPGGWWIWDWQYGSESPIHPTVWMPLPLAPSASDKEPTP